MAGSDASGAGGPGGENEDSGLYTFCGLLAALSQVTTDVCDLRVTPNFLPPPTLSAMPARASVPAPCDMSIAVHPKTGIRLQSGSCQSVSALSLG